MSRPNSSVLLKSIVLTGFCSIAILVFWWWGLVRSPRNQVLARGEDSLVQMKRTLAHELVRAESTGLAFGAWWKREQGRLDDPVRLQNAISFLEKGAIITNLILSRENGDSACIVRKDGEWNLILFRAGRNPRHFRVRNGRWEPGPTGSKEVYAAKDRHWYQFGAAQSTPAWTPEAYRFFASRVGGFTFTVPMRDPSGQLEGVIGVDVSLEELTQLIWEHQPTPGTRMLVSDASNRLLVPPRTPELLDQGTRFEHHLLPLPPSVLVELGKGKTVTHHGADGLLQPGGEYVSTSGTYAPQGAPHMNLHVAIPEEDLFPGLHRRRVVTLLLALGAVAGLAWSLLDLNRRIARDGGQAVQERKRLLHQVEQSQRADSIGMMAPGIVHDVNNHLALVLGQIALCQTLSEDRPELQPRLRVAEDAAKRCADVLRGLLDYSRPASGGRERMSLNATVSEAAGLLRRVLGDSITIEEDLGLIPLLYGDPVKLQQVIVNLGMNARDAMPEGGLLRFRTSPSGEGACLEVEDTGCGMSAEIQERIFEPFFSTKEHGKGTGLGLAMVGNIVAAHGGSIHVHSEPGTGTRFLLEFPNSLRKETKARDGGAAIQGMSGA